MPEKEPCDNARNKVNTNFRLTISSNGRKRNLFDSENQESCEHEKLVVKSKKRKKRNKKPKGKLEKGCRYNDYGEQAMENCCTRKSPTNCTKPQSAWAQQRESYLDNVTWSSSQPMECPGYTSHLERLSRVENICKDPCSLQPTSGQCRSHHPQCPLRSSEGRKRHSELQPTPPAYICRPITPTKQGTSSCNKPSQEKFNPCAPAKKQSKEKVCKKKSAKTDDCPPLCCCCPEKKKESSVCTKDTCPNRSKETSENTKSLPPCCCCPEKKKECPPPTICTIDTCPNRNKETPAPTDNVKSPPPCCCCPEKSKEFPPITPAVCTKETCSSRPKPADTIKCPPRPSTRVSKLDLDSSRAVRFDAEQCTPRVAARFENGVLEAYSQFKVAFPPKSTEDVCPPTISTKKLQTERTTCDCGVGADCPELTVKCCCVKRNPSKRNASIGTQEPSGLDKTFFRSRDCCCGENGEGSLESEQTLHDYVLLTPGGKYVPLMRTKSNQSEKVSFECCMEGSRPPHQQRAQDYCDNVQTRTRDEDKCGNTTTQLLLRCFEHMLNLEDQEEKGKSLESREDACDPCKRKPQERRQSNEMTPNEGCLPCLNEKQNQARATNAGNSRGKLTQNFLEILKCALEIDNKRNDCEEEAYRQDSCECDAAVFKVEHISLKKSPSSRCDEWIGDNDEALQDEMLRDRCKSLSSRPESARSDDKQRKCSQEAIKEKATVCFDESLNTKCENENSSTQNIRATCSSKEIQCEETKVPVRNKGTQKRDTVLQYLVKCANRSENPGPYQSPGRVFATAISNPRDSTFDFANKQSQGLNVVKCDQYYQTYMVRPYKPPCEKTFDRRLKQFHNRICAFKRIEDPQF